MHKRSNRACIKYSHTHNPRRFTSFRCDEQTLANELLQPARKDHTIVAANGDFLRRYKWSYFGTLTFNREITSDRAHHKFLKWIRRLEQDTQGAVAWFDAIELHQTGGAHIHTLVYTTCGSSSTLLRRAWKSGISHVVPYVGDRGATHYVTKDILTQSSYYDISRRRPPFASSMVE